MISRKFRLKRNRIALTLKKGDLLSSDLFLIRYLSQKEDEHPHFSVITSLKLSKSAIKRNRIRRKIYEAVRLNMPENLPLYIVIIPKKNILEVEYDSIEKDISKIFKKLINSPKT